MAQVLSEKFAELRERANLKEESLFEYKSRSNRASKHIDEFDDLVSRATGLLFVLAVNKNVRSCFAQDGSILRETFAAQTGISDKKNWIERLMIVTATIAYLLTLVRTDQTKFLWQTDRDSIVDTEEQQALTAKVLGSRLNFEFGQEYDEYGFAHSAFPVESPRAMAANDLLAIPDIYAGVVAEVLSNANESGNYRSDPKAKNPNRYLSLAERLCGQSVGLRTMVCVVEPSQHRPEPDVQLANFQGKGVDDVLYVYPPTSSE